MNAKLRVSKLEAGKRQLETAVTLYFNYGDPVSIHSLSVVAYAIFRDLYERRGGEPVLKDLWRFLDTRAAKEFKRLISQPDNLFKPANNDPNGVQELDPELTEAVMVDAAKKYCEMTGEHSPALKLYMIWFVTQHPEIFAVVHPEFDAVAQKVRPNRLYEDRHRYFVDFLPFAASLFPRPILATVGASPESPGSESTGRIGRIPLAIFDENERDLIVRALHSADGNKVRAARLLQISRKKLYAKIEKYRLFAAVAINPKRNLQRQPSSRGSKSRKRVR